MSARTLRWSSLIFLILLSVFSAAQSFTPVREQANLSPAALATLNRLLSLNELPAPEWHMHVGDLPHGESTTLDDSAWPLAKVHDTAPFDSVWFRRRITVPRLLNGYDLTGTRITFQFRADANGPMPQILYFNGRRVAMGDDLEPVVLFEPAKPGDTVEIAVKLLRTVDRKRINAVHVRIEPIDASAAKGRPNPEDIRAEAISAANLLPALPKPRPDLLPELERAVAAINTQALDTGDQAAFDASLVKAHGMLGTLHAALATATIDLAGNSHIDAAWLWPESETMDVVRRTFTTALQLMSEYPGYTYTQSAAQYSEWMADKYPALNDQIRERIKEGRWEIVGGMWVEPDLNLPDGESLVRQLLVGQRFFQKQYGVTARIGWNPDSFGYTWQMPQIYKRSGMDYFVTQKMHWNDTNQLPFRLFWWQSPDGSKVLTYFPTDYVHDNVNPTRVSADFAESAKRNPGTSEMLDLYGIGDHGGGPTRAMLDQADHWIAASKGTAAVPALRYHTAQQYFTDVEAKLAPTSETWNYDRIGTGYKYPAAPTAGKMGLPTWKDELYFEYHRGIFTTQARHKANMRRSEVATLDAEKLASLAWLDGRPYPNDELTYSWKKITFNQFHDLAAGSGIGVIYRDAQREYNEVFSSDHQIAENSILTVAARVDTRVKAGTPVLLFNPLAWPRSETVELSVQLPESAAGVRVLDSQDRPLLTQLISHDRSTSSYKLLARVEDLPSMGYKMLHTVGTPAAAEKPAASPLRATEAVDAITLSNGTLELHVDRRNGCITSLRSNKSATESLAPGACGNQLQTFKDTPTQYDAWNVDPGTLDHFEPISSVDSVSLVTDGPLRKTVRVARHWGASKFVQDISLDAGADSVDIGNEIDWHETHVLLKAAFPLAHTGPKASFEIPYGAIDRTTERSNTWQKAQFEVPAMRWADLGDAAQGLSLLNDSKYGYDALGNTLRLTLLRSPTWPAPDADRGHHSFHYTLYPHTGAWKDAATVHRGYELNYPISATAVAPHTGALPPEHSFASVENANVILTAMKKAEDADALVFRMYEFAGRESAVKLHVPAGAISAIEVNLMERPEGSALPLAGGVVTTTIHPYQILTMQAIYPKRAPEAN